jgi:hypothetical protein
MYRLYNEALSVYFTLLLLLLLIQLVEVILGFLVARENIRYQTTQLMRQLQTVDNQFRPRSRSNSAGNSEYQALNTHED